MFRAAIYGGSGYADGNQEILAGLERQAWPIQLVPLGAQGDEARLLPPARRRKLAGMQQRQLDVARSVLYQSMPAADFETGIEARFRIGRTTFETDGLPPGWRERCNAMDEVWVPSRFNREMFARAGVEEKRLRVMPEGLDTQRFRPGPSPGVAGPPFTWVAPAATPALRAGGPRVGRSVARLRLTAGDARSARDVSKLPPMEPLPIPCRRGFNFLSVFDWIDRKGGDVLLRAYLEAFGPDDDVALILKIHKFDEPEADLEARLLDFIEFEAGVPLDRAPCIIVLRGLLPARDMPRLYASADAYVLPSRGEGWGRPYMEAAASGLPVLATRWSGHLDFLDDANSYLIDIEGVQPVPHDSDREIYIGQGWAEPSVEHLSQLMRYVVSHREEARARGARARRDMVERWDSGVIAPLWTEAFQALV